MEPLILKGTSTRKLRCKHKQWLKKSSCGYDAEYGNQKKQKKHGFGKKGSSGNGNDFVLRGIGRFTCRRV
jgi:hypothetical protein